jgi:hypothetical protein
LALAAANALAYYTEVLFTGGENFGGASSTLMPISNPFSQCFVRSTNGEKSRGQCHKQFTTVTYGCTKVSYGGR